MTATVTASEFEKNFGLWHDRSMREPVQITDRGRETAYLVSAETFQQLWSTFRRVVAATDLSDEEMALIMAADVPDAYADDPADVAEDGMPMPSGPTSDRSA